MADDYFKRNEAHELSLWYPRMTRRQLRDNLRAVGGRSVRVTYSKYMKRNIISRRKNGETFNVQAFLDSAGVARKILEFERKATIFAQGDICKDVMYVQKGSVKLSVVSKTGKEAVVALLKPGDFVGEGALAGQPVRIATATAATPVTLLVIGLKEMIRVLHAEHALSDRFITYILERNIRIEEDLVDQLFNSSEKRLARTLLLLARYDKEDKPSWAIPKVSQETLAEMIGTTRSRVNFFMNKFKKLGFIKYNGGLHVNDSLLAVVLHD
jgi:CRP/FNR family cyclic AMP-dependent transcriptional regulator